MSIPLLGLLLHHPVLATAAAAQLAALALAVRLCRGDGHGGDDAIAVLPA